MNALVTNKLSANVLRDAMLTGKCLSGEEAFAAGIVDSCCEQDQLIDLAKAISEVIEPSHLIMRFRVLRRQYLPVSPITFRYHQLRRLTL